MQNPATADKSQQSIPMSVILMVALAVHLPLFIAELPLRSYDANFHIFFASHYLHHWFNPWNTKWFAGFSQTTYPPLAQQWVAILSWICGLTWAYMAVEMISVLFLAWGMYRFAAIWVSPRAASFAALAAVLLPSEAFLLYNAGQLATTAAAPLYLFALPFLYRWLRYGGWRPFIKALMLFTAAAAVHHVTIIFGSMFFALPILALAYMDRRRGERAGAAGITARAVAMTLMVGAAVFVVLLPFWLGLFRYPITQTPIPHPSRSSYILSLKYGVNYFLIPYGALILALPFIILRGSRVARLRPLMIGFWVCFLIGLGGTTPVGHWMLGRAFNVLTFERFSYWATLLCLPIVGALASDLVARFRMRAAVPLGIAAAASCAVAVGWTTYHPTDNVNFKVTPVAEWLNRGGHNRYRYITLGFGNKLARLAMLTTATSVDGESNSSRMLPELTKYGGGALSAAKYYNPGGLESLQAMLRHADRYGLKWIFVYDPYYDPLLHYAGWRQVDQLDNGEIAVWAKDGIPPAHPRADAIKPAHWEGILWGTAPVGSSVLAILVVLIPEKRRYLTAADDEPSDDQPSGDEDLLPGHFIASGRRVS